MNYTSKSELETKEIAAEFAVKLQGGEVIELVGDLGVGKTVFVRAIVETLGSEVRVKSPTFTIMNEYPVDGDRVKRVIHIDLYRFKDESQIRALELDDYISNDSVVCIEWPDVFGKSPFDTDYRVNIDHVDENTRRIIILKNK